jgi:hypothetical protein
VTTVFLLVIYLGNVVQQSDMHFRDINRCRYFANRISKQPAVPGTKNRYTGICKPVTLDTTNPNIRLYQ